MEVISLAQALRQIDDYDGRGYPKVNEVVFAMGNTSTGISNGFVKLDKAVKCVQQLTPQALTRHDKRKNTPRKSKFKASVFKKTPKHRLLKHRYGNQKMLVDIDLILIVNGKAVR